MRRVAIVVVCALAACGRFGFTPTGAIGDGGSNDGGSSSPDANVPADQIASVLAGSGNTCTISGAGVLTCWGANNSGQLGTGVATFSSPPTVVPGVWSSVALDGIASCGLQPDNSLWCWGDNSSGQLGDGTTTPHLTPAMVGVDRDWAEVDVGDLFACARTGSGTVYCWGDNQFNEVMSAFAPSVPTPTGVVANVAVLSTAESHACVVLTAGTLECWGHNEAGELGTGDFNVVMTPTQIGARTDWATVSTGDGHTCAITTGGTLWCWGAGTRGELGTGLTSDQLTPVQIGTDTDWLDVIASAYDTCARKTDHSEWCFGATFRGTLGTLGAADDLVTPTSFAATVYRSFALGLAHACTVDNNGVVACSGGNGFGELALTAASHATPTATDALVWTSLSGNGSNFCGIAAGQLYCWGDNDRFEVGDGTDRWRQQPATVGTLGTTWTSYSAGTAISAGITAGGLYFWGRNPVDYTVQMVPTKAGAFADWVAVAAGNEQSCALRTGGGLYCSGINDFGELGTGNMANEAAETAVDPATTWANLALGYQHACATKASVVECWGNNQSGQLGINMTYAATPTADTPQTVKGLPMATPTQVVSGDAFSCTLFGTGELDCWGNNQYGQLATGNMTFALEGAKATTVTNWHDVCAGGAHICGIDTTGALWCWGDGEDGELGTGDTTVVNTMPRRVGAATNWSSLACGAHTTCALTTAGARYCWGLDDGGEYGDNLSWRAGFAVITP